MNCLIKLNFTATYYSIGSQILDSVNKMSYSELVDIIYDEESDLELKKKCAYSFYRRGRISKNEERIADGYRNLSYIGSLEENSTEIIYLDSLVDYTRNKNIWGYPAFAYYIKGLTLYDKRDFKNSLDNFLEAHKFAKKNNNLSLLYDTKHSIALLKSLLGSYKESLKLFKECYEYLQTKEKKSIDRENLLITLHALSDEYRRNKKIDSSSIINKIGIKQSLLSEFNNYRGYFILSEGINHFERGDFVKSIDSIKKSLFFIDEKFDKTNIAFAHFYLAKNYLNLNQNNKAINFFKKVDNVFNEINDIHPDLRESYEVIIDYYKELGDINNQLFYVEKLIEVDSVLFDNYKYISKNIVQKFDTPELLSEKEEILKKKEKEKNSLIKIISALVLLFLTILFLFLRNFKKKELYKRKFKEILQEQSKADIRPKKSINNEKLNIPEEIISHILLELENFEKNEGYLKKDLTITFLAKQLKTNTKYLSKVINLYQEKSFSNYINNLRINYAIEKLKSDKKFRNYTIKAISDSTGFKNSESFSQAFNKNKGIYPSFFIKELNKSSAE